MKTKRLLCALLAVGFASTSMFAYAAKKGAISLKMNAFKEAMVVDKITGEKKKQLVAIDSAVPGDTIVYVTEYTNISTKSVDSGAVISNRVPKNTHYLANSAYCENCTITYSVNGSNFAPLENLRVPIGQSKTRAATSKDVKHIRWKLNNSVAPNFKGNVGFKIKINKDTL